MPNAASINIFEAVESLFQPDSLITFEYFEAARKKNQLEPERRLLLAVLEDGIGCFQKHSLAHEGTGKKLFREAEEWIFEEDNDGPFSFENICEALGYNPAYFRKRLLLWKNNEGDRPARAYHAGSSKKAKIISYRSGRSGAPPIPRKHRWCSKGPLV